jgi:hypothetical protein
MPRWSVPVVDDYPDTRELLSVAGDRRLLEQALQGKAGES